MAGFYAVADRRGTQGWGGLALPFPSTQGPLVLDAEGDLKYVKMSETCTGDVAKDRLAGIWTSGVSDCSVVAIVEYRQNAWRRYFFEHVAGSYITEDISRGAEAAIGSEGSDCFALVAQSHGGSAFRSARDLFDQLNIPKANRSYYQSCSSGMSFGLRFQYGRFGEVRPYIGDNTITSNMDWDF